MRRRIEVDLLSRVEGTGALTIAVRDGRVEAVRLRIMEPPRLFEALLVGRGWEEAPDITARICGLCPVAYQMSACQAMEALAGVVVTPQIAALRRLLYCGEWIASHCAHMFLLHLPDFLGFPDLMAMAREHGELVRRGLRMKRIGNALMRAIGGREIHPVNVRLGGFYRAPDESALRDLQPELEWGLGAALETAAELGRLEFPALERDYEFVALRHHAEYPIVEGRIVSSRGLECPVEAFDQHIEEHQVPHSTALRARIRGRGAYLCGPLARINLNFDRLGGAAREAAARAGLRVPCTNPFKALLARAVEVTQAFEEALELVRTYVPPRPAAVAPRPVDGVGAGATEAPRGLLWHRYEVDAAGRIRRARIVPPTAQNQAAMEEDLRELAPELLHLDEAAARQRAEWAVRNHDPCISCATHFLDLRVERR